MQHKIPYILYHRSTLLFVCLLYGRSSDSSESNESLGNPGSKILDDLGSILFTHVVQAWANVEPSVEPNIGP